MKNTYIFILGLCYCYMQISVVEYQKAKLGNWYFEEFPKHIVIKSFFANKENEIYRNYVKNKKCKNSKGIPIYFEFKNIF